MIGPRRFIDYRTALLLVVANMIGTGVFTTLGLQAEAVPDGASLLLLWLLGAVVALCGALSYAELVAAVPRSGGEYHFLSRIYHPALGRLAGLVSVTVGFAAPVALAAMALGRYVSIFIPVDPLLVALGAVLAVTAMHAVEVELGRAFQIAATWLKVAAILLFSVVALAYGRVSGSLSPLPTVDTPDWVLSAPFGLSLIYVSYAYAGWNAAAYVAEEVRDPARTVPRALVRGTLTVAVLYLLLNLAFLRTIGLEDLAGTVEVGALSARTVFGDTGGMVFSLMLSLLLVSTISAMVLAGPRVLRTMGEDIPALRALGACNRRGAPTRAILLQQGLSVLLILTDSFEAVLTFAGFTLTLFACMTVAGVFRLRVREPALPRPFRVPLYPLPPLVFVLVNAAALLAVAWERPRTALIVLALLGVGGFLLYPRSRRAQHPSGLRRGRDDP
jgi:APA family basic amino acid/polyamine antiporter